MRQTDLPTLLRLLSDRARFARRDIAGLSVSAAAHRLGTNRRTISRWEAGQPPQRYDTLLRLAQAYGVDFCWLLTGTGSPTP